MTVHVLDPDASSRSRLRSYLVRRGLSVTEAGDLSDTERICRECPPRAIVTELVTHPEEVVSRLKKAAPRASILILTGCSCPLTVRAAQGLGSALLRKPSDAAAVAFLLGRLMVPEVSGAA